MEKFLYIIFIKLYPVAAVLISPFNNKARLWLAGRKNILEKIKTETQNDRSKKIWMHCSSLGEFEQGRPVLEKLKKTYSAYKLVLTFFSPSGYEIQKNNAPADYIFYMPMDSAKNAKIFLDIIQPSMALFVKYEYWYFYLKEVHRRKITLLLVSGIFFPESSFFKMYGNLYRKMLTFFTHLFVQTELSNQLLKKINIENVTIAGDTRFDRVLEVAAETKSFPEIEQFICNAKIIVAGSTWSEDDEALDHFANIHHDYKFIIAPHDISNERLKECCRLYKHSVLYSVYVDMINKNEPLSSNINTLIIDNIGMLKFLYRYASLCFIGGGFGNDEIHNILEAAVYYKPVLFGPAHEKFFEAIELINAGGAFDVEDALELEEQLNELLTNKKLYDDACFIAGNYVKNKAGATNAIINYIQANRLLTN